MMEKNALQACTWFFKNWVQSFITFPQTTLIESNAKFVYLRGNA
jgi:hypothetical protein